MWFLIGFVLATIIFILVLFIHQRKIVVRWYEWFIGIVGIGILLFAIQNLKGALDANWVNTSWTFLWVFGIPSVVFLVLAVLLPWLRYRRTKN